MQRGEPQQNELQSETGPSDFSRIKRPVRVQLSNMLIHFRDLCQEHCITKETPGQRWSSSLFSDVAASSIPLNVLKKKHTQANVLIIDICILSRKYVSSKQWICSKVCSVSVFLCHVTVQDQRGMCEEALLKVKGVISFTFQLAMKRCTVRVRADLPTEVDLLLPPLLSYP